MVSNLSFAVYAFALLGFLASSALCDNPCVAITRKCASTCTSTTTSSVKIGGVTTANWCVAFSLTPKNASGSIDWSSLNGNQAISGCVCNRGAGDYYVSTTSKPYLDASNNFYATSAANNSCGAAGNWWGIWGYTTTKSDTATFIVSDSYSRCATVNETNPIIGISTLVSGEGHTTGSTASWSSQTDYYYNDIDIRTTCQSAQLACTSNCTSQSKQPNFTCGFTATEDNKGFFPPRGAIAQSCDCVGGSGGNGSGNGKSAGTRVGPGYLVAGLTMALVAMTMVMLV